MIGKIAIEEAWQLPELAADAKDYAAAGEGETLANNLVDIHGQRLKLMDELGVEFQVLSLTSPGPQGMADPKAAAALATKGNDTLSTEVKKNPKRFGGLASVSMHSPEEAAREAKRAITQLGLVGVILNDFQTRQGADGQDEMIFFDQPEYDVFWKTMEELDALVYVHPRLALPRHQQEFLAGRKWLRASAFHFATGVSLHVLGIVCNGVFDRFPNLRMCIGHMGEAILGQIWRIQHRLDAVQRGNFGGLPMKRSLQEYFKRGNLCITTSGHFSTNALNHALKEIGAERVMFSIDYPYEVEADTRMGCEWWDAVMSGTEHVNASEKEKWAMTRNNAISLLKLPLEQN